MIYENTHHIIILIGQKGQTYTGDHGHMIHARNLSLYQ